MMEYLVLIVNLLVITGLAWLIYRLGHWPLRKFFVPALVLHLMGGWAVGWIYTTQYGGQGDTFQFYRDAVVLSESITAQPSRIFEILSSSELPSGLVYAGQPRALFISKILALLKILTFGDYWTLAAYLSLFSFWGLWMVANQITRSFAVAAWTTATAFLFVPTVVYWGSGILKESLAMGLIGLLIAVCIKSTKTTQAGIPAVIVIAISFLILANLKYYTAALLGAVLATTLITEALMRGSAVVSGSRARQLKFWFLIFVVLIFAASSLHPNLYPQNFLEVLVQNHDLTLAKSSPAGSVLYLNLEPTIGSVLLNSPWAVFSCLFRPFFTEVSGGLGAMASVENLVILILTIAAIRNIKMAFKSPHLIWIMGAMVYVLLGSGFIGLSTPNLGTLVRYKTMFLPFLVLLLLIQNPLLERLRGFRIRADSRSGQPL